MTAITGDGGIYNGVLLDIGDPDGLVFTETFLNNLLAKAVRRLNHVLGLSSTSRPRGIPGYKSLKSQISPITYSLASNSISPDNDEIADLIILMMEYIIKKGEISALKRLNVAYGGVYKTDAANDDLSVKNADGVEVRVGANRLSTRARLFEMDLNTIKEELDNAIKTFLYRQVGNYSKMIF